MSLQVNGLSADALAFCETDPEMITRVLETFATDEEFHMGIMRKLEKIYKIDHLEMKGLINRLWALPMSKVAKSVVKDRIDDSEPVVKTVGKPVVKPVVNDYSDVDDPTDDDEEVVAPIPVKSKSANRPLPLPLTVPTTAPAPEFKLTHASTHIGRLGEHEFEECIKKLPDNYTYVNTSKKSGCGDFHIKYTRGNIVVRCIVDIKKYRSSVPQKEIDKFHKDLAAGEYECGMMVSLTSKFVGMPDNITLGNRTCDSGNVPVIYVSSTPGEVINYIIELLICRVAVAAETEISGGCITNCINTINMSLDQLKIVNGTLRDMQTGMDAYMATCRNSMITMENLVRRTIKSLMYGLRGPEIEVCVEDKTVSVDIVVDSEDEKLPAKSSTKPSTKSKSPPAPKTCQEPPSEIELSEICPAEIEQIFRKPDQERARLLCTYVDVLAESGISLTLKPLKTVTRIITNDPGVLESQFEFKKGIYTATLNKEFITFMAKTFT